MCGLTGVFGRGDVQPGVARASDALAHRGPDDHGAAELRDAGGQPAGLFSHRRLAIIDLTSCSHQPMVTADGAWSMVFNGEIYNYQELRRELLAEGVAFHSDGDTEVLLEGFRRHGAPFLARLRGMFAFAMWDARNARGYIGRDPFGIKPMYFCQSAGRVAFASEVRALLAGDWASREIDPAGVASFLTFGSVSEPRTMLRDVTMLPAGTLAEITIDANGARLGTPRAYGGAIFQPPERLIDDPAIAARVVRDSLRESVGYHMVSDVPVGLFLSGGIDSSAVVALASEIAASPVSTFTVGFEERAFDESAAARVVARRFGTHHHEVRLTGAQLLAMLPDAIAATDQPSLDGINTYVVSKAVHEHGLKVVLSGLGGDEMFAGYPSFARAQTLDRGWHASRLLRAAIAPAMRRSRDLRLAKIGVMLGEHSPAAGAYRASRLLFGDRALADAMHATTTPLAEDAPGNLPLLQQVSWLEVTGYMRNTLLRDSDVYSMRHGLELRVPFVDIGVAAASASIADSLKLRRGTTKPLLVDALTDLLPREVWDRPKQGFTLPMKLWMQTALAPMIDDELRGVGVEAAGLDVGAVSAVRDGFRAGKIGWSRPWALYMLARWAREHIAGEAGARARPARVAAARKSLATT